VKEEIDCNAIRRDEIEYNNKADTRREIHDKECVAMSNIKAFYSFNE
jgi:hypothetical protein